jgi:ribosomal protein S18 acetylase RimI-like enzyme
MIEIATPADEADAIGTLVLAFSADPAVRWTWPDPMAFLAHFPIFAQAFAGNAFHHGSAYRTGEGGHSGVALWLPPGIGSDEEGVDRSLRNGLAPHRQKEVFDVLEQMAAYHPSEPHWYLPLIGVDPWHQGKGQGAALMKHAAQRFDEAGQLAYLEATNPKSLGLYERHGFELLGRIQEGDSPTLFPMLRRPRR